LPEPRDGVLAKKLQLTEELWHVKGKLKRWTGRVTAPGTNGVHFHQFIDSLIAQVHTGCC
jgi:hypothetical protein